METTTFSAGDIGFMIGVILGIFGLSFVIFSYAIVAFLLGRLFKKAGLRQWPAWVPLYNNWKLLELGGQPGFWAPLALIPYVGFVTLIFTYIAAYHIGLKLGKSKWFVGVAIFLPLIWLIWLAFDDSQWPKPKEKKKAEPKAKAAPKTVKKSPVKKKLT